MPYGSIYQPLLATNLGLPLVLLDPDGDRLVEEGDLVVGMGAEAEGLVGAAGREVRARNAGLGYAGGPAPASAAAGDDAGGMTATTVRLNGLGLLLLPFRGGEEHVVEDEPVA